VEDTRSRLQVRRLKGAMSDSRIVYTPRSDATFEGELAALAAVYAFVIRAHERKKAAAPTTKRRKEVNPEERRLGKVRKPNLNKEVRTCETRSNSTPNTSHPKRSC